jgi:hypothetical protein
LLGPVKKRFVLPRPFFIAEEVRDSSRRDSSDIPVEAREVVLLAGVGAQAGGARLSLSADNLAKMPSNVCAGPGGGVVGAPARACCSLLAFLEDIMGWGGIFTLCVGCLSGGVVGYLLLFSTFEVMSTAQKEEEKAGLVAPRILLYPFEFRTMWSLRSMLVGHSWCLGIKGLFANDPSWVTLPSLPKVK